MVDTTQILFALACDALWQSTAIFIVALLLVRFAIRRPALAHAVLLLAFIAAVAAPAASQIVRQRGWGLLPAAATAADNPLPANNATHLYVPGKAAVLIADSATPSPVEPMNASAPQEMAQTSLAANPGDPPQSVANQPALPLFLTLWLTATIVMLARLLRGMLAGIRILAKADRCTQPAVTDALAVARQRLALGDLPIDAYRSRAVRCPLIWCWGRRPCLLLPVDAAASWSRERWIPILTHELAHWKRRDHLAALTAEIVCALLPWQVLAWWAKRSLETASEQACDDWTVAAGHSAVDYAETLLGLVAQADPPLALAALRRRSSLAARVRHILDESMPRPRLGRLWAVAILLAAVATVGVTAVCQRSVARAEPQPSQSLPAAKNALPQPANAALTVADVSGTPAPAAPATAAEPSEKPEHIRTVGRILSADGQPVAGADVYCDIREHGPNVDLLVNRTIASTKTDAEGRFTLDTETVRGNRVDPNLVVRAPGYGVQAEVLFLRSDPDPVEVRLEASAPLEGTILSPAGQPLAGARVMIIAMNQPPDPAKGPYGWSLLLNGKETNLDQPRAYWPAPVFTDADGKFRFADAVPRRAVAKLEVQAADFATTRVAVALPDSVIDNRWKETYRQSPLTLELETPFVIDGRFVDEKSGQPIPGTRFEVTPFTRGIQIVLHATSDADGRYTMRLNSAQLYFITAYPPAGYPGVINSLDLAKLADPDRKFKYEVKLRRGITLTGRVVDAANGAPVAQANVVYKPQRGRDLGFNNQFFPVATDADGNFEVTAVSGRGSLLVDAPGRGFYRLAADSPHIEKYQGLNFPNGMLELDIPDNGQTKPCVISLHPGPPLVVRALSPAGKPVERLEAACAEIDFDGINRREAPYQHGLFQLDAAEPGRKYRIFLFSEDAKAGTVAEVVAPADGKPVEVKLQPLAKIRGRYVYKAGVPAPEICNFSRFRWDPDRDPGQNVDGLLPYFDNFFHPEDSKRTTDADGNFELTCIVPGMFIYLRLNNKFASGEHTYPIGILAPDELRELGEIVIQPEQ